MEDKITVLLVEKDPQTTQLLLLLMAAPAWPPLPFTMVCVDGLEAARAALAEDAAIQVVLLDPSLTGVGPLEALRVVRAHAPSTPVVMLIEPGEDGLGLAAVGAGAQDYQVKTSLDARTLKRTLSCAILRRPLAPRHAPRHASRHAQRHSPRSASRARIAHA
jgi:DNA-binding NarL/FixJ family response regulator